MVFQVAPESVPILMVVITDVLGKFHMELQRRTSRVHIPNLAAVSLDERPSEIRSLEEVLPLSPEGIAVLGADSAGEKALPLGP